MSCQSSRINLTVSEPLRSQDLHQTLIFKVPCELILCSIRVPAKEMVVWQIHFAMPDCLRMKHTTPPPTGKHRSPFVISPLPRSVTLDFGTSGRCYTIQFLEIDERDGFLASTSGRMVFGGLIDADRTEQVEFGMDAVDCCEGEWRVVKDHVSG